MYQHKLLQRDDVLKLVASVMDIMNEVSVSDHNGNVLIAKLHRMFMISRKKVELHRNFVYNLPSLANLACYNFADYLRQTYPSLTENEILFCCLYALGASANCISMVYGYEHYITLYNKRSKIRKKITDIPQDMELDKYISNLVEKLEHEYFESLK